MADTSNLSSILQFMGLNQSDYSSLSTTQQAALTVLGAGYQTQVNNNGPVPDTLSKKEMNKLWNLAQSDPTINQYYANELTQAKDVINMNVATDTDAFNLATKEQQESYISDKLALDAAAQKAGSVYSGFRNQAKTSLNSSNQDVIQSTTSQLKNELNQLGNQFESTYGSSAIAGTALANPVMPGNIGGAMGTSYTGPSGTPVAYSPMGNVSGSATSSKLANQISELNELAQEKLQGESLKNIKSSMLSPDSD